MLQILKAKPLQKGSWRRLIIESGTLPMKHLAEKCVYVCLEGWVVCVLGGSGRLYYNITSDTQYMQTKGCGWGVAPSLMHQRCAISRPVKAQEVVEVLRALRSGALMELSV